MSARLLAGVGVLAFAVLTLSLATVGVGPGQALFLGTLLALLPAVALAQVPLLADEPLERERVYLGSAALLLILGGLSYGMGAAEVGAHGLGLAPWPGPGFVGGWAGILLAAAGVVVVAFHRLGSALGVQESPLLADLLPRTSRERGLFAGLSLAAGVGEELAYRGYAIPLLTPLLGSEWGAAVLTSSVFGVLHAYQGVLGVLRTAVLGLILGGGFILSGSLWPGIAAHVAIDLLGGLVLGDRLFHSGSRKK